MKENIKKNEAFRILRGVFNVEDKLHNWITEGLLEAGYVQFPKQLVFAQANLAVPLATDAERNNKYCYCIYT